MSDQTTGTEKIPGQHVSAHEPPCVDRKKNDDHQTAYNESETAVEQIRSVLQRVSATLAQEIEQVVDDLKVMRLQLQQDGNRLQREIANYANSTQAAMHAIKNTDLRLTRIENVEDPAIDRRVAPDLAGEDRGVNEKTPPVTKLRFTEQLFTLMRRKHEGQLSAS
jgi:hypothetical protein